MFGRGTARQIQRGLRDLGIEPRDYLRMMLPGLAPGDAPRGEALDLEEALDVLEGLGEGR